MKNVGSAEVKIKIAMALGESPYTLHQTPPPQVFTSPTARARNNDKKMSFHGVFYKFHIVNPPRGEGF